MKHFILVEKPCKGRPHPPAGSGPMGHFACRVVAQAERSRPGAAGQTPAYCVADNDQIQCGSISYRANFFLAAPPYPGRMSFGCRRTTGACYFPRQYTLSLCLLTGSNQNNTYNCFMPFTRLFGFGLLLTAGWGCRVVNYFMDWSVIKESKMAVWGWLARLTVPGGIPAPGQD